MVDNQDPSAPRKTGFINIPGNAQDEILVGWEMQTQRLSVSEVEGRNQGQVDFLEAAADNASGTGQGGSLARFKIVEDFLYAVDSHTINVFDISNLEAPVAGEDVFAGFDIETIFNREDHLFLGSMRGMYIFDISNPAVPAFVSEFQHGTACDPVVVDGDYAFVTLRGAMVVVPRKAVYSSWTSATSKPLSSLSVIRWTDLTASESGVTSSLFVTGPPA